MLAARYYIIFMKSLYNCFALRCNERSYHVPSSTCWNTTNSKCLFYLTKFQIKPFQLHVTKMRSFVSIAREVGIVLHIFYVENSKDKSGRRITNNTKGEIMNSPEKRRGSRYELHA